MFDGIPPNENPAITKLDQVIAELPDESVWIKGQLVSGKRRCLKQVLADVNAPEILDQDILNAARELTGHVFTSIPCFNDDPDTTFKLMTAVLWRTRENLLAAAVPAWITNGAPQAEPASRTVSKALATVAASILFLVALAFASA